jgi:hypothetical protein
MQTLGFGRTGLLAKGVHRFAGAGLMINTAVFAAVVGPQTTVIGPQRLIEPQSAKAK